MKNLFLLLVLALTLTSCDSRGGFEDRLEMTDIQKNYMDKNMLPVDSMAAIQGIQAQVYTNHDWSRLSVKTGERYLMATTLTNSNLTSITEGKVLVLMIISVFFGILIGVIISQ